VGNCSTVDLADEYGTPLVVYCEETIRSAARAWRAGAPEATIVYGTKAFPNVAIMRLLVEEGIGADVSTLGELRYAQAAGVPSSATVVHGNNKSHEELAAAAETDAWLVVMDEPGEVERCAAAGVKRVLLRITPGIEAGGHGHDRPPRVEVRGRAGGAHASSRGRATQGSDAGAARAPGVAGHRLGAARSTVELLAGLCVEAHEKLGWTPAIVNLGGGLGIRYVMDDPAPPSPEEYARAVSERLADVWSAAGLPQPQLIFEPGRSLVGRAGLTLYGVGVVKTSGATTWVAVDGGMSDNPRPDLYGARYSALVANRADEPSTAAYAVCGKHCESGDVLIEHVELADPRRDDVLAVPGTGAYSLSMASNYNALPRPAAVLVSEGGARVISSREADLARFGPG
jgi:diaminopimelate decarboxylase